MRQNEYLWSKGLNVPKVSTLQIFNLFVQGACKIAI